MSGIQGVVGVFVDDFLLAGVGPRWESFREAISTRFLFGSWESGTFSQCGVRVTQLPNYSLQLDQEACLRRYLRFQACVGQAVTPQSLKRFVDNFELSWGTFSG